MSFDNAKNFIGALSLLVLAAPVRATLIGDLVEGTGNNLTPSPGPVTVVDPGVEFNIAFGANSIAVDIGNSTISFQKTAGTLVGLGTTWIYTFSDLDWIGNPSAVIDGVSILSNSITGFDLGDLSYDDHAVTVNLNDTDNWGGSTANNGFIIELSHTSVPLPATFLLMALGLAGISVQSKCRQFRLT